ncbi:MAG: phosphoglycerate kinase [Chthonomonadaceae bacterium]|nr:phosphoglycerate kinase [Chthonomonadaceae bacterium]
MNKKTIEDIEVTGKRVLVRVDFNVPQDEHGAITDDNRITAALPTIQYLTGKGAKVILISHLGRPKGVTPKYTLEPISIRLEELLEQPVELLDEDYGIEVAEFIDNMENGQVVLLENVRFHPQEEANDPEFAKRLSMLGDIYVNDAFGTAHRAHASTEGVTHFLPSVAGFLMKKELDYLGSALDNPKRPFIAILGGAKVKDKISVIKQLLTKVDKLIVGGGMAYTFQKAKGYEIGKSLFDASNLEFCKEILATSGDKLILPVDAIITDKNPFDVGQEACETKTVSVTEIPADWEGADIGPESVKLFAEAISGAETVVWNGPMGIFEYSKFADGTIGVAQAMADSHAITIIGGGDSAAAAQKLGFSDKMTHISTGGGASLEFLEGKELPGVAALQDK